MENLNTDKEKIYIKIDIELNKDDIVTVRPSELLRKTSNPSIPGSSSDTDIAWESTVDFLKHAFVKKPEDNVQYSNGIYTFKLKEWKNGTPEEKGSALIKAIKDYLKKGNYIISWQTNDPQKTMKGLVALVASGDQQMSMGGMGLGDATAGQVGGPGVPGPSGMGQSSFGAPQAPPTMGALGGMTGGAPTPAPAPGGAPTAVPVQQAHNYIDEMKKFIKLWENKT